MRSGASGQVIPRHCRKWLPLGGVSEGTRRRRIVFVVFAVEGKSAVGYLAELLKEMND